MSLRLRRIQLDGFRKFRQPFTIDGLADGLNIVIEPNETGKSTLLEALRAAFFVRHGTRNQLAQSYAPHGDAVGPEVCVAFEVDGAPWTITKRFLKGMSVEINGPQGRAQGDEAEARLHTLLGSVRDTSQRGDPSTYGALGLLWVAQGEALAVTPPGQLVRDTVRSTLEAEVGSIMGGAAYKKVRDRIEEQFLRYWSPTGQKRGRQNDARERLDAAEAASGEASDRLAGLERTFVELESAKARLKVVVREVEDDTDVQAKEALVSSLEVAKAAAQILATRRAEYEAISARVGSLEDLSARHEAVAQQRDRAQEALDKLLAQRAKLAGTLAEAQQRVLDAREALDQARADRQDAKAVLTKAEAQVAARRRKAALSGARLRLVDLLELERRQGEAKALAATEIPADRIAELESNERAVAEARAMLGAGSTRIRLLGDPAGFTIDGEPLTADERTLTQETRIGFGEAELLVIPPLSAESAHSALASALETQRVALEDLGVDSLSTARARNDAAREAAGELRAIAARIEAVTIADDSVGLVSGPEALKLFVADRADEDDYDDGQLPDIALLGTEIEATEIAVARSESVQSSVIETLRLVEQDHMALAAAEAGAESDLANARMQIEAIEGRPEFLTLPADLAALRADTAAASVKLEEAQRDATAHDVSAITRKIETIDARGKAASEARTKLEMEIARLEGIVESEGGKGLGDREAAAREEAEAARDALLRVTEEAETLKLLRETLDDARNETSARFVGPVAKRAKRHIERLLPGCELSFTEDLALDAVIRGGVREGCGDLSKGTQEQLAVLTRIAFADMLLEQGRPVSLVLDDPLVYSDDARLDLMVDILIETAERMQVILLTCRERAFRHVPGHRPAMTDATQ